MDSSSSSSSVAKTTTSVVAVETQSDRKIFNRLCDLFGKDASDMSHVLSHEPEVSPARAAAEVFGYTYNRDDDDLDAADEVLSNPPEYDSKRFSFIGMDDEDDDALLHWQADLARVREEGARELKALNQAREADLTHTQIQSGQETTAAGKARAEAH